MLKYGDVFELNDDWFVYIAQIDNRLYAAKIINKNYVSKLNRMVASKGSKTKSPMFCFVVLKTPELQGQGAVIPQKELGYSRSFLLRNDLTSLIKEDILSISEEIKQSEFVPEEVKIFINSLQENNFNSD